MQTNKRKYPRVILKQEQETFHLSPYNEFIRNIVLSENISASGFCFRSLKAYKNGHTLLVYLKDNQLEDLNKNKARIMKFGKYVMAQVVWNHSIEGEAHPAYEIGCSFVELGVTSKEKVNLFMKLVNLDTAEKIQNIEVRSI